MYGVIVKSCEVGISSGNQALTRCAFDGTDLATPTGIASGFPVRTTRIALSSGRGMRFFIYRGLLRIRDRKSTRLNSSHDQISYAVFCLKKKNQTFFLVVV